MEKVCFGCKEKKDVIHFDRDSQKKDGYTSRCKDCRNAPKYHPSIPIPDLEGEIWIGVVGHEDSYQVSNFGRIKSLDRVIKKSNGSCQTRKQCIINPITDSDGYNIFSVSIVQDNNKRKQALLKLHREIAKVFIKNGSNKPQVNHINGIKTDNRVENLEWVTNKENMQHAYKTGLNKGAIGEKAGNAKITKEIVLEIRRIGKKMKLTEIGEIYGLSFQHISDIINRKKWKHI